MMQPSTACRALVVVAGSTLPGSGTGVEQRRNHLILGAQRATGVCGIVVVNPLSPDRRAAMARAYGCPVSGLPTSPPTARAVKVRRRVRRLWSPRRVTQLRGDEVGEVIRTWPERFGLVLVEAVESFDVVRASTACPVVVDLDDVPSMLMEQEIRIRRPSILGPRRPGRARTRGGEPSPSVDRSMRRLLAFAVEWARWRLWERRLVRRASLVLVCSDADLERLDRRSRRLHVVPNGFDAGAPPRTMVRPGPAPSVAFWGLMAYRPNADGARWFVTEVLPELERLVPEIAVKIVGSGSEGLELPSHERVSVLGHVEDLDGLLATVDVAIVPLRIGGGTRIKIVEAWARGVPVVSTTTGARGLEAASGRELLLADEPDDFARAVHRVIVDDELRGRLVALGAERAATLTWRHAEDHLVDALGTVLVRRSAPAVGR